MICIGHTAPRAAGHRFAATAFGAPGALRSAASDSVALSSTYFFKAIGGLNLNQPR